MSLGFPGGPASKEPACEAGDPGSIPEPERSQGKGNGNPLPVFLPGEFHGQRNLSGYSPWGCKVSDMTEPLTLSLALLPNVLNQKRIVCFILQQSSMLEKTKEGKTEPAQKSWASDVCLETGHGHPFLWGRAIVHALQNMVLPAGKAGCNIREKMNGGLSWLRKSISIFCPTESL